ncbi:MAG TPA: MarR family winged helix-turn-helix transcriptional regulator [Candidatus Limnocylindrales bacterium]
MSGDGDGGAQARRRSAHPSTAPTTGPQPLAAAHGEPVDQSDPRLLAAIDRLVGAAVGLTARMLAEADQAADLTLPQWRAVVVAGEDAEGRSVGEIAGRLGLALPSASRLVRRLVRRGLVTIAPDARDRRRTLVRLTPAGIRLRGDLLTARRELVGRLLADGPEPLPSHPLAALESIADRLAASAAAPAQPLVVEAVRGTGGPTT